MKALAEPTRRARLRGGPARRRLHDRRLALRHRCCWRRRRGGWSGSACRTRTPTSCWSTWRRGSPPASSRPRPSSTRRGASSTSTSRASSTDFDLPLDWQLSEGFRLPGAAGDRRASPTAQTRSYTQMATTRRQRARGPRRRHRLRPQPDPARRPLPPRPAQRRRPRRLRRRPADEAGAAASSRACSTRVRMAKGFAAAVRSRGHATEAHRVGRRRSAASPGSPGGLPSSPPWPWSRSSALAKSAQALTVAGAGGPATRRRPTPPPTTNSKPKKKREEERIRSRRMRRRRRRMRRRRKKRPSEAPRRVPAEQRPGHGLRHRAQDKVRLRRPLHRPLPDPVAVDYGLHGSKGSLYLGGEQAALREAGRLPPDREPERGADGQGDRRQGLHRPALRVRRPRATASPTSTRQLTARHAAPSGARPGRQPGQRAFRR